MSEREKAMQDLADQAQKLDMGYGSPASDAASRVPTLEALLAECEALLEEYTTDFERNMDTVHRADALLAKLKTRKETK